jgi:mRNA-degrading endonuclease RelE of RelBE toxin-antitoxin system
MLWRLRLAPEAAEDMRRLHRRHPKVWRSATKIIESLPTNPYQGAACDPPLDRVRRRRFWYDRYRIAWRVRDDLDEVHVLTVGLKSDDFYHRVEARLFEWIAREEDEP